MHGIQLENTGGVQMGVKVNKNYNMIGVLLICGILLAGCEKQAANDNAAKAKDITAASSTIPVTPTPTPSVTPTPIPPQSNKLTIDLRFKKFTNQDNTYPEDFYEAKEKEIRQIYKTYDYEGYQFMVYDGADDGLHIGYRRDGKYYSLCQIDNWDSGLDRETFEKTADTTTFRIYTDVLGTSGVYLTLWNGAASSNDFYLSIDEEKERPKLLVSYCTGGFLEKDIDFDKKKELMSFGGLPTNFFLIIEKDGELMFTDYLYYNGNPIFYDDRTSEFFIMEESDKRVYMEYNKDECVLVEK